MTHKPPPLPSWVPDWLSENPYFTAGAGLFGVGALATIGRQGLHAFNLFARRRFLTTLEIPSRDHSYQWVMQWLIQNGRDQSRHLGVATTYVKDNTGNVQTHFDYIPSTGRHFMWFRGRMMMVDRERNSTSVDLSTGTPFETLTLTTLAFDKNLFQELLMEARDSLLAKEQGSTIIYHPVGQEWRPFGDPKRVRPLQSVILEDNVCEAVLNDVVDFQSRYTWYLNRGIPYRRGYLLWGPPGTGKSSFVTALAGTLKYSIAVLNVGDPMLTDDRLQYLLATAPPKTILLLEDIDGAVTNADLRGEGMTDGQGEMTPWGSRKVTFSGLLNALDGVVATEERIIFMTTNNAHRLPPVLVRPGRVDMKIRIGLATPSQCRRMFLRFFPGEEEKADQFAETLKSIPLSMAELQGYMMFFKDTPDDCLSNVGNLRIAHEQGAFAKSDMQVDFKRTMGETITSTSGSAKQGGKIL
eukprot:GDKJ01021881.1.p1 GENE.GDKJ01021881.1~~GDKJ01021881.1.p1  ORF type:complete len:505 (-),score=89.98 GDKJ01021881.1:54-1457(-)